MIVATQQAPDTSRQPEILPNHRWRQVAVLIGDPKTWLLFEAWVYAIAKETIVNSHPYDWRFALAGAMRDTPLLIPGDEKVSVRPVGHEETMTLPSALAGAYVTTIAIERAVKGMGYAVSGQRYRLLKKYQLELMTTIGEAIASDAGCEKEWERCSALSPGAQVKHLRMLEEIL